VIVIFVLAAREACEFGAVKLLEPNSLMVDLVCLANLQGGPTRSCGIQPMLITLSLSVTSPSPSITNQCSKRFLNLCFSVALSRHSHLELISSAPLLLVNNCRVAFVPMMALPPRSTSLSIFEYSFSLQQVVESEPLHSSRSFDLCHILHCARS
jgi:hypothetical protein